MAATTVLAVIVGLSFAWLLVATLDLRGSVRESERAQRVLVVANNLERLVIDLETGARGYLLTHHPRFLEPWDEARRTYAERAAELQALVRGDPDQASRVRTLTASIASYIVDYSVPVVESTSEDASPSDLDPLLDEGRQRLDEIRGGFDELIAAQRVLVAVREDRAATQAQRAVGVAAAGLVGSIVLVIGYTAYLRRAIVGPVLRASTMARRLAEGDLGVRMPETGVGEIGQLERSFNEMASSLAESRGGLQRLAGEQAALRRVATLVAEGRPSHDIFTAAAEEVALVFGADVSAILRAEPDGLATVVATHGHDERFVLGSRMRPSPETAVGSALSTGRPVRMDHDPPSAGGEAQPSGEGVRSAVGVPVLVEARPWGAISIASMHRPFAADTEQRMREFTELLGTAVANAQARAELLASRARIVSASDEARRRIERDIHDGAQQRLVSLGLELRGIEASLPAELDALRSEVGRVGEMLEDVLESLRDLSRGIHPAILSRGGLAPALKALVRRTSVPVDLRLDLDGRLPEAIEVGAYYLVSEALTNATKHARAEVVVVRAAIRDGWLELSVRDDGVGGADPSLGSGLTGLRDRAAALGGTLEIVSPPEGGTTIAARVPVRAG